MFSKKDKVKLESFIGSNTRFQGTIKTEGTLRVDGRVDGNIEADWLVLGENSSLKGNASATGIVVGGLVEGNLTAKEIVEVKDKGQVRGDVLTTKLTVSEGGLIDGRVSMQKEQSKIVELAQDKLKGAQF